MRHIALCVCVCIVLIQTCVVVASSWYSYVIQMRININSLPKGRLAHPGQYITRYSDKIDLAVFHLRSIQIKQKAPFPLIIACKSLTGVSIFNLNKI